MFKKPLIIFGMLLSALMTAVPANAWTWDSSNTLYLDSYGLKLSRPSERWRALNANYPNLVELRWMRAGVNVAMTLKDYPFEAKKRVKPSLQNKHSSSRSGRVLFEADADALLMLYRNAGYQFFDIINEGADLFATGTNANREILFLYFQHKSLAQGKGWFVLEMTLPREAYLDMKPQFDWSAASLKEAPRH